MKNKKKNQMRLTIPEGKVVADILHRRPIKKRKGVLMSDYAFRVTFTDGSVAYATIQR